MRPCISFVGLVFQAAVLVVFCSCETFRKDREMGFNGDGPETIGIHETDDWDERENFHSSPDMREEDTSKDGEDSNGI